MAAMIDIEDLTRRYADRRGVLAACVQKLNDEVEAARRRRMTAIKSMVALVAEAESKLRTAIEENPGLFERPRTVVIAGVRVGFTKGKGSIDWEDDGQVVKLIRKHLSDQADALIKTVETPIKAALANLAAADLKRIGVTVEDTGDRVVVKPTDGEVDKIVAALLKAAAGEDERS